MKQSETSPSPLLMFPAVWATELLKIFGGSLADRERQTLETLSAIDTEDPAGIREIVHGWARPDRPDTPPTPAALCLSGGGIRSASFALGVLQGLAKTGKLDRFHYLSTVSGGGYIGSWLSTLIKRTEGGLGAVIELLRRPGPDPGPVELLRQGTSYLTPHPGILSADTWAAITLFVRNLALNWLLLVPFFFAVVAVPPLLFSSMAYPVMSGAPLAAILMSAISLLLFLVALTLSLLNRPTWEYLKFKEPQVVLLIVLPYVLGAAAVALAADHLDWIRALSRNLGLGEPTAGYWSYLSSAFLWGIAFAVSWLFAAWIAGIFPKAGAEKTHPLRKLATRTPVDLLDFVGWVVSGLLFGLGIRGALDLVYLVGTPSQKTLFIIGMPLVLFVRSIVEMLFTGFVSVREPLDDDREWFGRLTGWLAAASVAWLVLMLVGLRGHAIVLWLDHRIPGWFEAGFTAAGGISGILTAALSWSSKTGGLTPASDDRQRGALSANVALALAATIFVAVFALALGWSYGALFPHHLAAPAAWFVRFSYVAVPAAFAFSASFFININRFSQQGIYRNRLIRAFLGPTRGRARRPNPFTQFDDRDNILLHKLWSDKNRLAGGFDCGHLFHLINVTLDLTHVTNTAWEERKAESFTASPLHVGNPHLGYRPAGDYGGPDGITLGTAMAISGAAVSPNMGYHSSPAAALLMTFFNVRLGSWLGNPRRDQWRNDGPRLALLPLLREAFSMTDDTSPIVYLSDGGHFENLGLYEMIRRRCRLIVVSDAGADPNFEFEDLGNAVRKVSIDMGVEIRFDPGEPAMLARGKPLPAGSKPVYVAVAKILYPELAADYQSGAATPGTLVYIKPCVYGTEPPDIRNYALAHEEFPHETTVDQWFTESQFESYRHLGEFITTEYVTSRL